MAQASWLLGLASLFQLCSATPWMGAMETPQGLLATAGISPRPTEAPGLRGIPKELKPRADYQYPPPDNWCGFVEGEYTDPLTCATSYTCMTSDALFGCCLDIAQCGSAAFKTSCVGFSERCNDNCLANPLILKCANPSSAYCATWTFYGGMSMLGCHPYSQYLGPTSVERMADFYYTAIGTSFTPLLTASVTRAADTVSSGSSPSASSGSSPSTSSGLSPFTSLGSSPSTSSSGITSGSSRNGDDDDNNNSHLGAAIIGGIVAGAVVICALVGLLIWICLRRRKRARLAASQQIAQHAAPTFNPQGGQPNMQQQHYQPVPQQDNNIPQDNSQYQPAPGYFAAPLPGKDSGAFTHISPVGSPVPSTVDPTARPFSLASSQHPSEGGQTIQTTQQLSPPMPGYPGPLAGAGAGAGAGGAAQNYYKPPLSPNSTEVDGTQGNPGVPHGAQQGANEVDGTQGNPGVPYNQQQYHGPYEMH